MPETEEERRIRKEKEREREKDRREETEEERRIRKEKERADRERRDRKPETEEERAARKERERAERDKGRRAETEEERAARKERERTEREKEKGRREETEEERAVRKAKERGLGLLVAGEKERKPETEEERAARKAREARAERDKERKPETEEERAARKEKERAEREKEKAKDKEKGRREETEEERAARKAREREERDKERKPETEEERAARKEKERAEREKEKAKEKEKGRREETEEERAARKAREKAEREKGREETEAERAARKDRERADRDARRPETEEERAARKEKERAERERERERERRAETEEERAARKARERAEQEKERKPETEEERAARKERERAEREKEKEKEKERGRREETEEERAARKAKERADRDKERKPETEEERAARKEKERAEREKEKAKEKEKGRREETEEERAARKAREKAERDKDRKAETEEERAARKEKERAGREAREKETPEQRQARKERERRERKEKEKEKDAEDDDYGEDFENYEDEFDDFEEEEEEEPDTPSDASTDSDAGLRFVDRRMMEMKRAMERENKDLARNAPRGGGTSPTVTRSPISPTDSTKVFRAGRKRLDPTESKRQEKLKRKYLKRLERARLLERLVDLDAVSYEVADLQPQTEYELYIGNFGSSNAAQASTQMPDTSEIDTADVQTDKIHFKNREVQVPEDLGLYPQPTGLIPQEKEKKKDEVKFMHIDTIALGQFMSRAYPVMRVLLTEGERATTSGHQKAAHEFSQSYVSLSGGPLLSGRSAVSLAFSDVNQQYLLVVYSPTRIKNPLGVNPDADVSHIDGLAALWNVNSPQAPLALHAAGGALTCGCWSSQRGHLTFAGGRDGAVYLWDHREPEHYHTNSIRAPPRPPPTKGKRRGEVLTPRFPTYSTEWMWKENHQAPIVRILPVGYNNPAPADGSEQVATLDARGTIMFWVVVEAAKKEGEISDTDLGLNMFGALKLAKSSQLCVANPQRHLVPEVITTLEGKGGEGAGPGWPRRKEEGDLLPTIGTFDLEFQPDDSALMLVGTDAGYVVHYHRFSPQGAASPPVYLSVGPNEFLDPEERARSLAVQRDLKYGLGALSVHFCLTDPRGFFAAGYGDGAVSVFKVEDRVPKAHFKGFTPHAITCVRWSTRSRGFILALDAAGTMFAFDLLRDKPEAQSEPFSHSNLVLKASEGGKDVTARPTTLEFSTDIRTDAKVAVAYDDGHVDLHVLRKDFVKHQEHESFFVALY